MSKAVTKRSTHFPEIREKTVGASLYEGCAEGSFRAVSVKYPSRCSGRYHSSGERLIPVKDIECAHSVRIQVVPRKSPP